MSDMFSDRRPGLMDVANLIARMAERGFSMDEGAAQLFLAWGDANDEARCEDEAPTDWLDENLVTVGEVLEQAQQQQKANGWADGGRRKLKGLAGL